MSVRTMTSDSGRKKVKIDDNESDFESIVRLIRWILLPFMFQYVLWSVFGQDVEWYIDILAGWYLGNNAIRLAVLCLVLRHCNFAVPLWDSVKHILGY